MEKTIRKAFKYRLRPHQDQVQKMVEFAGCSRFVWNKALFLNLRRLEKKEPLMWYNEQAYWLTLWKESDEYGFLDDCHSQVLQQKLKDLNKAFQDAFDKNQPFKKMPVFKRKGSYQSFRYPQGFKVDEAKSKVFLPKIGWIRYYQSRKIQGLAKNITVSKRGKNWYVSIQTEYQQTVNPHPSHTAVGIDVGIKRFATLSNGAVVLPLNSLRTREKQLAQRQRALSRKTKFSMNWKKEKQKIAVLHEKIANCRLDYLHKASTRISQNHAMIFVEDLKVKNMSQSASGDIENPGKMVKAKSGLNKSILDQGWAMFVNMLTYKQSWRAGDVIKVNPRHTSQTCPACQYVSKLNRQTQERFECVACQYTENADLVGAINILARGHRVLACGEMALATQ